MANLEQHNQEEILNKNELVDFNDVSLDALLETENTEKDPKKEEPGVWDSIKSTASDAYNTVTEPFDGIQKKLEGIPIIGSLYKADRKANEGVANAISGGKLGKYVVGAKEEKPKEKPADPKAYNKTKKKI